MSEEVRYQVGVEDIVAFNDWHHQTSAHSRRLVAIFRAVFALMAVGLFAFMSYSGTPAVMLVPWCLGAAILVASVPAIFRWSVRRSARRLFAEGHNRGVLGPHHLEVRDDFLLETSDLGEQRTHWRAVERVAVTDDHVFVYLSAMSGHTVPRSAFADEAALQRFVAAVRERIVQA